MLVRTLGINTLEHADDLTDRVWSAICCVTCGIIAAIVPLVLPSCQDVEHICPNCLPPPFFSSLVCVLVMGVVLTRGRRV